MLNEIVEIIEAARPQGWVMEPEAKRILALGGIDVPRYRWAKSVDEAAAFCRDNGYPVAVKVVSPSVVHKSDAGGVAVGIRNEESLISVYERFSRLPDFAGVVVEEMVKGVELIIGAKMDYQFGPVILLGMGGTGTEIYQDVTIRLAPLGEADVCAMFNRLKGRRLLEGYRNAEAVNMDKLSRTLLAFSALVMDMADHFESIDLNPVMCGKERCVAADARIILKK
ncbi:MAG: acetate--CoA ligase family protein [Desulfurivibrionaceae bacterium]